MPSGLSIRNTGTASPWLLVSCVPEETSAGFMAERVKVPDVPSNRKIRSDVFASSVEFRMVTVPWNPSAMLSFEVGSVPWITTV